MGWNLYPFWLHKTRTFNKTGDLNLCSQIPIWKYWELLVGQFQKVYPVFHNNTLTKTNMEAENGDPLEEEMPFGGKLHHFPVSQVFFPDSKIIPSEEFVRFIRRVMQRNLRLESPNPSYGLRLAPCHSQKRTWIVLLSRSKTRPTTRPSPWPENGIETVMFIVYTVYI